MTIISLLLVVISKLDYQCLLERYKNIFTYLFSLIKISPSSNDISQVRRFQRCTGPYLQPPKNKQKLPLVKN